MGVVGSNFNYNKGDIVLLEESPDSGVGCHFALSNMHQFVYQRCRHRCRSVRTEEETELVLPSMKLRTCVIGPETLHFHDARIWTLDQVSVQRATIISGILLRCLLNYETKATPCMHACLEVNMLCILWSDRARGMHYM